MSENVIVAYSPIPVGIDAESVARHVAACGIECCFPYRESEQARNDVGNIAFPGLQTPGYMRVEIKVSIHE